MKKCLLVSLTLGLSGMIMAQSMPHSAVTPAKLAPTVKNKAEFYRKGALPETQPTFSAIVNGLTVKTEHKNHLKAYTQTYIGNTGYQLQTNSSVMNRVIKNADGTICATWTMSQLMDNAWADRGTGYNYYNGTAWAPIPTLRVENIRTGFQNIGVTNTGAEFIISHQLTPTIHVASRPVKGTGTWTDATLGFADLFPRFCVGGANGITLHVISSGTNGSTPVTYLGQLSPITYSRSLDGGVTWDKIRTVITPIDSTFYKGFGGDSYAMDVKGDTIAIVAGDFTTDVVLVKSVDNGNTWTKTIVRPFAIPLFDEPTMLSDTSGDGIADTLSTNDGSLAVLLDNAGKAHVWYGNMRMLNDNLTDAGVSYFPGTDGLMYWNENMGAAAPVMIASAEDLNGDGTLNVTDWGTYQVSLTSQPSAGIAPDGKIYVSYAGIFEGNADQGTPGAGKSFRHTYVMCSTDGGATWCTPHDVSDPGGLIDFTEGVYGAMSRDVDSYVHLVIEQDASVGHGVSTTTSPDPQGAMADIVYTKIPVTDLYSPCTIGINESTIADINTSVYPNPATTTATLSITTLKKESVKVKVSNVIGQVVNSFNNEIPAAGTFDFTIDLNGMSKGVYFVNVTVNGKSKTSKLVVE